MADMTLKMLLLGQDVSASRAMRGVGKSTDESTGKFKAWHTAAAAAGVIAGAAVVKFGKDSVSAYKDAQAQQAQLEGAFQRFPALADTNITALRTLNSELERKTGFDDDATASGQAVLAQFKLTGTQITQLTPLLQDYATRTGQDLPTAAASLGKAVLGQGRALKAVGINFKDTHDQAKNFDQIVTGLRQNVGGYAEQQGKTAAGQTKILGAEFGELEEKVGSGLVPALTSFTAVLIKVVTFVTDNIKVVGVLAGVIAAAATAAAIYNVAMGISAVLTGEATASTVLQTIALGALKVAQLVSAGAQWALNAALTANPIGLVVVAIAALVAGLILAYRHSATFRAIVQGAFHGIVAAGQWMWKILRPIFDALMTAFHAAQAAASFAANIVGSGGPSLGSLPQGPASSHGLRGHAAGGIFTKPTVGLIGEAGPEALIPLSAGRSHGGLGGGDVYLTNNFYGPVDKAAVGKQVVETLVEYQRQQRRALPLLTSGAIG